MSLVPPDFMASFPSPLAEITVLFYFGLLGVVGLAVVAGILWCLAEIAAWADRGEGRSDDPAIVAMERRQRLAERDVERRLGRRQGYGGRWR